MTRDLNLISGDVCLDGIHADIVQSWSAGPSVLISNKREFRKHVHSGEGEGLNFPAHVVKIRIGGVELIGEISDNRPCRISHSYAHRLEWVHTRFASVRITSQLQTKQKVKV